MILFIFSSSSYQIKIKVIFETRNLYCVISSLFTLILTRNKFKCAKYTLYYLFTLKIFITTASQLAPHKYLGRNVSSPRTKSQLAEVNRVTMKSSVT